MMATSRDRIALSRLSFVIYEHPSLQEFRTFATDFGFVEPDGASKNKDLAFFTGYGTDPFIYVAHQASGSEKRFIGAGFAAESEDDFVAAQELEDAEDWSLIDQAPGGGQAVVLRDPNGFDVVIVWAQRNQEVPVSGLSVLRGKPEIDGAVEKRRKGEFTRMDKGPALIHKLGHFGYTTTNYERTMAWYQNNFNLILTDVLYKPDDESVDVAAFLRLDRGQVFSDHHCFLIARGEPEEDGRDKTDVHHSSFEVEDVDTQFIGHDWLKQKGYELVWGIGRHVHGSQAFDYWYDPSRFIIEHYADGDVVNEDTPLLRAAAGNMAVWGPPVPAIWGHRAERPLMPAAVPQPVVTVAG